MKNPIPLKINYFGLIKSVMSWAHVARETVLALDRLGCDISITNCRGHLYNSDLYFDKRLRELMEKERNTEIEITFEYPLNYGRLRGKRKIGLLVYETTIVPPAWIENIVKHLDFLVVPGEFCRKVMTKNGVPAEMIKIAPYGYDPALFSDSTAPVKFGTKKGYKFLCFAMPHLRKGLDILISAFTEEFSSADNAALIIKTPYLPFKNMKYWEIDTAEIIRKAVTGKSDIPEIILINKEEDPKRIPGYFAACDCYVQPSRSEGFGIAVLEAMAMNKPVITTGWGGQTDFCDSGNSFLMEYEIRSAGNAQYGEKAAGAVIAEPSKDHLRKLMRCVYENRENATSVAKKGRSDTAHMTWDNSARRLVEIAALMRIF